MENSPARSPDRSRRIYVYWGVALGLLLALGIEPLPWVREKIKEALKKLRGGAGGGQQLPATP